jgi:hypothetical protein
MNHAVRPQGAQCLVEHISEFSVDRTSPCGEVYTAARNTLGLERAKALTMFSINDCCQVTDQRDGKLLLSVVEGEFADKLTEDHVFGHSEGGNRNITITFLTAGTSATAPNRSNDLDISHSVHPILEIILY